MKAHWDARMVGIAVHVLRTKEYESKELCRIFKHQDNMGYVIGEYVAHSSSEFLNGLADYNLTELKNKINELVIGEIPGLVIE
jgi:hypothetical protein